MWFYFKPSIKGKGLILPDVVLKQEKRAYLFPQKKKKKKSNREDKKKWVKINYFCNRPR